MLKIILQNKSMKVFICLMTFLIFPHINHVYSQEISLNTPIKEPLPPLPQDIPIFTFTLNHQIMSTLHSPNIGDFKAFSGKKEGQNNPYMTYLANIGALPKGTYYIVDRPQIIWNSNAYLTEKLKILSHMIYRLAHDTIEKLFGTPSDDWFALYRYDNDGLNDHTILQNPQGKTIIRAAFRLHPLEASGHSRGCIVLQNKEDFYKIRHYLLEKGKKYPISDSQDHKINAYGAIIVQ